MTEETHYCKSCETEKVVSKKNFYTKLGKFDLWKCKECRKEYSKKRKDTRGYRKRPKMAEYMRQYRLKKKEEKKTTESV